MNIVWSFFSGGPFAGGRGSSTDKDHKAEMLIDSKLLLANEERAWTNLRPSPSFKPLDEDSEELIMLTELAAGDHLAEIKNDDCKSINERTIFDHIREMAKSLPFLAPISTTEYLASEETLSLIRKRTRERQLARKENTKSLNLTDYSNPCEESIEPEGTTSSIILNGDTIFEHIRKKAKSV
ncbi:hypothetical protein Tco_0335105 [Tanacetum coccineum]